MKNRIETLIKEKGLSSVKFAEAIGVQPSSISHVLSGRSKPSFDFMEKISSKFPDVNMNWLISGTGEMYKDGSVGLLHFEETTIENNTYTPKEEPIISQKEEATQPVVTKENQPKEIERILVFFSDKTFKEYSPS